MAGPARRLHVIYGPTGCGKTDRATALARRTGASVVVLDRIQCHPELAVGSSRPAVAALHGTHRVYLCDRPLSAGELPAPEAHRLLVELVDSLAGPGEPLILEGGSVSLLNEMARAGWWTDFEATHERVPLEPAASYLPSARARMREMLQPSDGRRGLLYELALAWQDERTRAVAMGVFGYDIAAAAIVRSGLAVEHAPELGTSARERLADELATAILAFARWQERELPELASAWRGLRARRHGHPEREPVRYFELT